MGLDAVGWRYRGYTPRPKGEDRKHTGGARGSPLSTESIFLIYRRQLFFDIAPRGKHRDTAVRLAHGPGRLEENVPVFPVIDIKKIYIYIRTETHLGSSILR